MKVSRRAFLRGVAGATLALPFLEAHAQSMTARKRLIVFVHSHGTLPSRWTPAAGPSLTLSELLQPLAPFKSQLNVVSGLSNAIADGQFHVSNGHNANGHTILTAGLTSASGAADGSLLSSRGETMFNTLSRYPSIDHALAQQLGLPAPLNTAVGPTDPGEHRMFYRVRPAAATENPEAALRNNPQTLFNQYLAGITPSPTPQPAQPPPETRADRMRRQQRSVLDAVSESFDAMLARVGSADRDRLLAHAQRVREIEVAASTTPMLPPPPPPATCSPALTVPSGYPANVAGPLALDKVSQLMMDVVAQIVTCGVNDIVTIQHTDYHGPEFEFLPTGAATEGWHALVHGDYGDPNNHAKVIAGHRWYAEQLAYLLGRLDAVTEPNGMTVLQNSLVLWISEMGQGNHTNAGIPVVLAGSLGGALQTDRHLQRSGYTTGDLYTSILQRFGVGATSFGYNGASGLNHGGVPGL